MQKLFDSQWLALSWRLLQESNKRAATDSTRSMPARRREAGRIADAKAYQRRVLET